MADQGNPSESGFSQEYVDKLRQENASWRTKYRDLESRTTSSELESELAKKGIKAETSWVTVSEGMSIADAVDNFAAKHPHLKTVAQAGPEPLLSPTLTKTPTVDSPGSNANTNLPSNHTGGRSLKEIQKDPQARSELRDRYRQLIKQASRQVNPLG